MTFVWKWLLGLEMAGFFVVVFVNCPFRGGRGVASTQDFSGGRRPENLNWLFVK